MPDIIKPFQRAVAISSAVQSDDPARIFAEEVAQGLSESPRTLPTHYLYDAEGSRLFHEITQAPEYYPTRTEAALLAKYSAQIRARTGPVTLVELGSGYSTKTKHLLQAYTAAQAEALHYLPVDVSGDALREARDAITADYDDEVRITGIEGTYAEAFTVLDDHSPQMLVFLGSSIGNFHTDDAREFIHDAASHLCEGDHMLLGVDLVKEPHLLEAAYNDAAGVTARFTKNYFVRMNRELGTQLDLSSIEHQATWSAEKERVETYAHFGKAQTIDLPQVGRSFTIEAGERILVEISQKFDVKRLARELETHGLELREDYRDDQDWFGLLLLQRNGKQLNVSPAVQARREGAHASK